MHNETYLKYIKEASEELGILTEFISDSYAICLKKDNITKYIIGYSMPINNSSSHKIACNKHLCSEILSFKSIPNVLHKLIFNPNILSKLHNEKGNYKLIEDFVTIHGFPILLKRNNTSKGEGVYLVNNLSELEYQISKIYYMDNTLSLSPFRESIREFRAIILDSECLLTYEKIVPFIEGDGIKSVFELLTLFLKSNSDNISKHKQIFDFTLKDKFNYIPKPKEKIPLQWKHNRFPGTKYQIVKKPQIERLAIDAAAAIDARFVSVDIIESEKYGLEVLEINSSVSIHSPIISLTNSIYNGQLGIFKKVLKKVFTIES